MFQVPDRFLELRGLELEFNGKWDLRPLYRSQKYNYILSLVHEPVRNPEGWLGRKRKFGHF